MPDQEIMREWVDRLRSGEYEQGQGRLRIDDRFCCLGVLCEIALEQGAISRTAMTTMLAPAVASVDSVPFYFLDAPGEAFDTIYAYDSAVHMPTAVVYDWAGIPSGRGRGGPADHGALSAKALADCNDRGVPFAQIADRIEAEWIEPEQPTVTIPDTPAEIVDRELVNA